MTSEKSNDVLFWVLNGYGVTLLDVVTGFAMAIVGVTVITLNSVVLDTMVRLKKEMEPADVMVSSLALADCLTGMTILYHATYNLANYQIYLECLIRFGLLHGLLVTSVLHLVCLTLDRYLKIISPFRYRQMCRLPIVTSVSVVVWVMSTCVAFLPAMGWRHSGTNRTDDLFTVDAEVIAPVCSYFGLMHPDYIRFIVVLFWAPFVVMVILYIHIFKVAKRHARTIASHTGHVQVVQSKDRHWWKYTKTVLLIMGANFICWLPVGIFLIMFLMGDLRRNTVIHQGTLLLYASITAYLNSIINPVIYALKIGAVRSRFTAILCGPRSKGIPKDVTTVVEML